MKPLVRLSYLIPCAALLFGAVSNAHADTVTATIYENGTTSNVPTQASGFYTTTTPTLTTTISNSNPGALFNFYLSPSSNDYTLSNFLTNTGTNGDTVGSLGTHGGDSVDNDVFQFTGTTTLTAGQTYSVEHDDGLLLYLDGNLAINQGGPTSPTPTSFSVATSGNYSFILDYAEVAGPPAALITDLPLVGTSVTPEPSSLVLIGTGLVAAAGVIRRRSHV